MFEKHMKTYGLYVPSEETDEYGQSVEMTYKGDVRAALSLRSVEEVEADDIFRASQTWIGIVSKNGVGELDLSRGSELRAEDGKIYEVRHATDVGSAIVVSLRRAVL